MRRRWVACLVAALAALILAPTVALADVGDVITVNGINYKITAEENGNHAVSVARKNVPPSNLSTYSGEIVIPETVSYEGTEYTVTAVGDYAFWGSSVTKVILPQTVITIGNAGFYQCRNLTTVSFDGTPSLTSIGTFGFNECTALEHFDIPSTVTELGDSAFCRCISLDAIHIPAGVVKNLCSALAGNYVFENLGAVSIDENNPTYFIDSGVLYRRVADGLVAELYVGSDDTTTPKSIELLDGTTSLGSDELSMSGGLFSYSPDVVSVVIPSTVTEIPDNMFYGDEGCVGLQEISLPDSITSIGGGAFEGCSQLSSIRLPDGLKSIGDSAFRKCTSLVSANLPSGLTSLGKYAFMQSALQSVTIPEGVVEIPDFAFAGAPLKIAVIPESVKQIGMNALTFDVSGEVPAIVFLGAEPPEMHSLAFSASAPTDLNVVVPEGTAENYAAISTLSQYLTDDDGNVKPGVSFSLEVAPEGVSVEGTTATIDLSTSVIPVGATVSVSAADGSTVDFSYDSDAKTLTVRGLSEGESKLTVRLSLEGAELASQAVSVSVPHTHVFSDEWTSDDKGHWHACVADDGATNDYAAHDLKWVTDKEAQVGVAGSRHQECAVCGWTGPAVEIPALEPGAHTVTLVLGNGSENVTLSVTDGGTLTRPADPTRDGYTFAGWFQTLAADGTLSDEWDFSDPVTADLTLYAGWLPAGGGQGTEKPSTSGTDVPEGSAGDSIPATGDPTVVVPLAAVAFTGLAAIGAGVRVRRR